MSYRGKTQSFIMYCLCVFQYDHLRSQATVMKEKYEGRIADVESERDTAIASAATSKVTAAAPPKGDVVTQVWTYSFSIYHIPLNKRMGALLLRHV